MKKIYYLGFLFFLAFFTLNCYAAENVIGWSLAPLTNFPSSTTIGNSYNLTYTIYNNHPVASIPLNAAISTDGSFTITNSCENVILAPKGSPGSQCTIDIIYAPQAPQAVSLQVELQYGFNRVRLPLLSSSTNFEGVLGGRLIGYMPGYFAPSTAQQLSDAGYTHILIAFGVFSTTNPGKIVSAFNTVTPALISDIKKAGIKVLLSLGGASSDIPNTTTDFHVAQGASTAQQFQAAFIASMEQLVTQYGFDGFDFDIELGLAPATTKIYDPQGDIVVLAGIINAAHAAHPNWLLTLAPQCANIAVTSSFSSVFANYSSLIMLTSPALTWAGVQVYNAGTIFGVDMKIYDPKAVNNPDASVALAVDMLAKWPDTHNILPYMHNPPDHHPPYPKPVLLTPSQIVLGYLAPNKSGQTDGQPLVPVATIKRAIQCLRTGVAGANSCGSYIGPEVYSGIGGVFLWQTTNDQTTNFAFAKALYPCVVKGNC